MVRCWYLKELNYVCWKVKNSRIGEWKAGILVALEYNGKILEVDWIQVEWRMKTKKLFLPWWLVLRSLPNLFLHFPREMSLQMKSFTPSNHHIAPDMKLHRRTLLQRLVIRSLTWHLLKDKEKYVTDDVLLFYFNSLRTHIQLLLKKLCRLSLQARLN